jgi:hypothetical protein
MFFRTVHEKREDRVLPPARSCLLTEPDIVNRLLPTGMRIILNDLCVVFISSGISLIWNSYYRAFHAGQVKEYVPEENVPPAGLGTKDNSRIITPTWRHICNIL